MCGLFKVGFYHEAHQIQIKKVFSKTLKGALSKAARILKTSEFKNDVTYIAVYSAEHVDVAKRRFYDEGRPISPWINFDFEEPIDDV